MEVTTLLAREQLLRRLRELEDGLTVGNYFAMIEEINNIKNQLKHYGSN